MWRIIVAAALVYVCGHPKFDGQRPAALDRALQGFYVTVNKAAVTGRQALTRFSDQATTRVKTAAETAATELTPSN
jgi:hypothetical protein